MLKRTMLAATTTVAIGAALLLVSCSDAHHGTAGEKAAAPAAEGTAEGTWRALPLIADGKVDPAWFHTGFGTFTVDGGALRTDCDARGMGLLVYGKEKLGDCQIRVVFRSKYPHANSGVYIRIDDGILQQAGEQAPPAERTGDGKLTDEGLSVMQAASEKELGPWYAVHHGYEVQIEDAGDVLHRTGAIYSLTQAEPAPPAKDQGGWRTMVITLEGQRVSVDVDGKPVTHFDAAAAAGNLPERKEWYEPKREPKRPAKGYIGLQIHDPGDVVWFKEVSVRPL